MTADVATRPEWTARYSDVVLRRLDVHIALLRKWNGAINLVSPSTLAEPWSRHVYDSVQLFDHRGNDCGHWADLGSGAGFPGMVVGLLAKDLAPEMRVTLVESDKRKAEFLRTVSRETDVPVSVLDARIETLPPLGADVVSARALAPLPVLCGYAERHLAPHGRALFLKGARASEEALLARESWQFQLETLPSATDPQAAILMLTDLRHV